MKKILAFLFISYCSYAQVNIEVIYSPSTKACMSNTKSISVKPGESLKIIYYHFPSYHDSWFWFIIVPYKNTYTHADIINGGGRVAYSEYIYGSGNWPTSIPHEGKYCLLAIDGSLSNYKRTRLCTITVTKNNLFLNDISEPRQSISISPNPTDGLFKIATAEAISEIQIHDQTGRCILKTVSNSVDITSQPNGVYFATIQDSNGAVWKRKIIKK